jgi:hypothetical protein
MKRATKTNRASIGYKERTAISVRVKEVCSLPPGEEFAVYLAGYSDEVVAAEMTVRLGRPIAKVNVAFVRKADVGPLREARLPAPPKEPVEKQLSDLFNDYLDLSLEVEALKQRVAILEKQLPKQGSL